MTEQEQLDDLCRELVDMKATAGTLRHAIKLTESNLSEQKTAFKRLVGTPFAWGKIRFREGEIEDLKQKIEDRTKPVVVWKIPPTGAQNDYIVDKVTPKRIMVKRIGYTCREQFNRDGAAVGKFSKEVIDIKATLGDDYDE